MTVLDGRLFASVPEAAGFLGLDERTVRRAISAGEIPATRSGAQYRIPTSWLLKEAATPVATDAVPALDPDALAAAIADRVLARLASALGAAYQTSQRRVAT